MNILVVGLGLIGGSICKALSDKTDHCVLGFDADKDVLDKALSDGAVKQAVGQSDFNIADMTVVCLHPETARTFIENNIKNLKKNSILTDVCGIKGKFTEDMSELLEINGIKYISTHPMAGKANFGYNYSDKDIFNGANFIITPVSSTDKQAMQTVIDLAKQIGFGEIIMSTPNEHDRIIAYTSQLAHIVSSAYVKSPSIEKEYGFSGGSFQDMTRVALLNEYMWASLFMLNRDKLLEEMNIFIKNISFYRDALANNDHDKLVELLREGRIIKQKSLQETPAANSRSQYGCK